MASRISSIFSIFGFSDESDARLAASIKALTGQRPHNLTVYQLALRHSSSGDAKKPTIGFNNNERLEYLGDAILSAVIAEYLFKKFPLKDEGFLTELRARLVNRETLNRLAKTIGLNELIDYDKRQKPQSVSRSMHGDALEALIGAVYLDRGFKKCRKFILTKLIGHHFDIQELLENDNNFKSRLFEWAQKENKSIRFESEDQTRNPKSPVKEFIAKVYINNEVLGKGRGHNKKTAEQAAASQAMEALKLNSAK